MNFWLSAGHPENWKMAIEQGGIWGVKPERKKCWEKISRGDIIAFYVTYPVSGVIGFGVVTRKFHDDKTLVWPDEKKQGKAIWTYRWRFDIKYKLAEDVWKEKKIPILGRWGGLNCIKNKDVAIKLLQQADVSWNTNLTNLYQPEASIRKKAEKKPNLHEEMKQKLLEIGVWQGYIAEPERKLDGERVDVAWVRSQVKGAVPKVVFEVQVSGSPKSALGNLKDAYDKWNSIPVIVVTESMRESVERLLYGMYHEILPEIKILTIDDVRKLHEGEKKVYEIKTKRTLGKVLDAI